ncbi:MAG: tRNA (adenosine(37)-N6)-threonylcarbamoyltransferase complex ATPase subunit type 1 TsaE [Gammaproteobacteria bacterium]|jgi:tRNA threonylcarbamoyladenosine biosynthesis protein TsaE
MDQSALSVVAPEESAFVDLAGRVAAEWRAFGADAGVNVGLCGELGAGKTAWVRAMLRGLGYDGRVPSPTYTLMEIYEIGGITLIHMDLYRISGDEELAQLGVRDWLGRPGCWLLAEWPQRAPGWFAQCDVVLEFVVLGTAARRIDCTARRADAQRWLTPFTFT